MRRDIRKNGKAKKYVFNTFPRKKYDFFILCEMMFAIEND